MIGLCCFLGMSLCAAIIVLTNGDSFKLDWKEGGKLDNVVDFLVEEGCDREDAAAMMAKFEEGGSSKAH